MALAKSAKYAAWAWRAAAANSGVVQPFRRILPNRLQHHQPGGGVLRVDLGMRLLSTSEARPSSVSTPARQPSNSSATASTASRPATGKTEEQFEEPAFARLQQLVAPFDRGAEGPLPRRPVRGGRPQQPDGSSRGAPAEPPAKKIDARCGELDRQRQAVQRREISATAAAIVCPLSRKSGLTA